MVEIGGQKSKSSQQVMVSSVIFCKLHYRGHFSWALPWRPALDIQFAKFNALLGAPDGWAFPGLDSHKAVWPTALVSSCAVITFNVSRVG